MKYSYEERFGNILRSQMEVYNITQTALAKKIGVTQKSISDYVNGKSQPSYDILAKLCKELSIDMNRVLGLNIHEDTPAYTYESKEEQDFLETYRSLDASEQKKAKYFRTILTLMEMKFEEE